MQVGAGSLSHLLRGKPVRKLCAPSFAKRGGKATKEPETASSEFLGCGWPHLLSNRKGECVWNLVSVWEVAAASLAGGALVSCAMRSRGGIRPGACPTWTLGLRVMCDSGLCGEERKQEDRRGGCCSRQGVVLAGTLGVALKVE